MSRRPAALPNALGATFSVAQARAEGVTERRLRAPDLATPFAGTRTRHDAARGDRPPIDGTGLVDAAALVHRSLMDAFATRMPEHAFFTGLSSLVAWCEFLPIPAPLVEVGTLLPHRATRARGVAGRQFAPHLVSVRTHDGIRVASPASTWVLLASRLPRRDLVAIGSLMVTAPRGPGGQVGGRALASIDELRAATSAAPRTGVAAARSALELVRSGPRSRPEVHLWLALVEAGLPEPNYDVRVHDADGRLIGFFDLGFPGLGVLVEYQGDYHRLSADAWARDITKRQRAREAGYTVVEVTRRETYLATTPAVERVTRALRGARAR